MRQHPNSWPGKNSSNLSIFITLHINDSIWFIEYLVFNISIQSTLCLGVVYHERLLICIFLKIIFEISY